VRILHGLGGMENCRKGFIPPHCPNPACRYHKDPEGWPWKKAGFYRRKTRPLKVQRFQCLHCHRFFGRQTFSPTYWLKRPDVYSSLFLRLLACSAFRQIARQFGVAPSTVLNQTARLGRHCLLFQKAHGPQYPPPEPVVIDGFESFEFSQFFPTHFHLAVGSLSHFFYAFTDSELRRKGRMTPAQAKRRKELESLVGRPDPKSIEKEVAHLLRLVIAGAKEAVFRSDDHPAYPRAFLRVEGVAITHEITSSKERRTAANPLFPVNLLDLLIRHNGANHKRETIAFSKRRQSAAERLAILQVWRNFVKPFSERRQDESPAQRLGLTDHRLSVTEILAKRLFPSIIRLPRRLQRYYRREVKTRRIPNGRRHELKYAY
jgi:transposase-like protein